MIKEFKGKYRFLSNFYFLGDNKIIDDFTIEYPTTEHYFQAQKTLNRLHRKIISSKVTKPGDAKKYGRKLELRRDWEEIKIDVIREGLKQKFHRGILKTKLLLTKPHQLIEENYWHDNFWGNCICNKCKNIPGKNWLGKLLMEIRDKQN